MKIALAEHWYGTCKIQECVQILAVPLLLLSLFACHFDPSTSAPGNDATTLGSQDGGLGDCNGFVSAACGDCGMQVCLESSLGAAINCVPDPEGASCAGSLSCNSEGYCTAQVTCSSGTYRDCGECGSELCQQGMWTGECVADDEACDFGTLCLSSDAQLPTCQEACSTEGHRTPYDDSDFGQGNGGGGGNGSGPPYGGGPIPDTMPLGDVWISIDGCEDPGDYRRCICFLPNDSGYPQVECENDCG